MTRLEPAAIGDLYSGHLEGRLDEGAGVDEQQPAAESVTPAPASAERPKVVLSLDSAFRILRQLKERHRAADTDRQLHDLIGNNATELQRLTALTGECAQLIQTLSIQCQLARPVEPPKTQGKMVKPQLGARRPKGTAA